MSNQVDNYSEIAKKLGCTFRIGKYGVKLRGSKLGGGRKLISITSLDGWLFEPKEIENAIRLDDAWEVSGLVAADSDASTDTANKPSEGGTRQKGSE